MANDFSKITIDGTTYNVKVPNKLKFGSKEFDGSSEKTITASDLGLSNALHFIGETTTALSDGSNTSSIQIGSTTHTATTGDVVLYESKEFVWQGSVWKELGDGSSHALKTISISADGGLTGGGTLEANRTISHADTSSQPSVSASGRRYITGVTLDDYGHVTGLTTGTETVTTPDISGKANLSGGNTFSGNQVITGYLDIRGTAAEKHLKTRGIGGSDGQGNSSDLYLQYSSDYKTYFGNTAQSSLNADGSISINGKTAATTDQIPTTASDVGAAPKKAGVYLVKGNTTGTEGTWTGTSSDFTDYYDGLVVAYDIGIAGAATTTLNINDKGAKTVYLRGTTKLTTHYAVGTIILLVYSADADCWYKADYDANTNTQVRVYRQDASSYNKDYPLIASRTVAADLGKVGTEGSYEGVYGLISDTAANIPTTNPYTGESKFKTVTATTFNGNLSGNATTATTATTADNATKLGGQAASYYENKVTSVNSKTGAVSLEASDVGALSLDGGTINKSKTVKMDASANSNGANLKWGTVNSKNPYIGYASDQTDGTFVIGSLLGTNYASGLAIGGGSGNLLWKGTKVATTDQIPNERLLRTLVPTGTEIGSNADLNTTTYLKVGRYYCPANDIVQTLSNCPTLDAFMMEVYSPLSTTIDNETTQTWCYRLRELTTYSGHKYFQVCYTNATANVWTYNAWTKVAKTSDIPTYSAGDGLSLSGTTFSWPLADRIKAATNAAGTKSVYIGDLTGSTDMGSYGFSAGKNTTVSGYYSAAIGYGNTTSNNYATAIGHTNTTSGDYGITLGGNRNTASGSYSATLGGWRNTASGYYSVAAGGQSNATGYYSVAMGCGNTANAYQAVLGRYATDSAGPTSSSDTTGDIFKIGKGTGTSALSNAFRVTTAGKAYGTSSFGSSGADYAEMWEWADGNPNNDERRGKFVTVDENNKIRIATTNDEYILGIISATPCVVGDVESENWKDMYLKDVFGQPIVKNVDVPEHTDEETGELVKAHTEEQWVLNPEYDPTKPYVSRDERKEWAAVGLMGKLVVVDDGTCVAGRYCKLTGNGTATSSTDKNDWRVLKRMDSTHVQILYR